VTAFVGSSPTPRMFAIETLAMRAPEPDAVSFAWSGFLFLAAAKACRIRLTSIHPCRM
jgi:hypothetical protein